MNYSALAVDSFPWGPLRYKRYGAADGGDMDGYRHILKAVSMVGNNSTLTSNDYRLEPGLVRGAAPELMAAHTTIAADGALLSLNVEYHGWIGV